MKKIVPKDAVLIPDNAKHVFKGQIFDVYQWEQKEFDNSSLIYEMLKRPDTVNAICIANGKVLVIEDIQPHVGLRLSFPGGKVDREDEGTLKAIQRELKEEAGYEFKNWRLVKVNQPHPKLEWFVYHYLAWDGEKVSEPQLGSGEKISLKLVLLEELKTLALNKAGYLGESIDLVKDLNNLEEAVNLPEFEGKEVDR